MRQKALAQARGSKSVTINERIVNRTKKAFGNLLQDLPPELAKEVIKATDNMVKQSSTAIHIDNNFENRDRLYKLTKHTLDHNEPVVYSGGRKVGAKEWLEMKVRTDAQHELVKQSGDFNVATRQVFVICDTYGDCADDHRDYQGQYYYYEESVNFWENRNPELGQRIRSFIRSNNIISVERITAWGTKGDVALCTRPNCRHRLIPVPLDDVLEQSKKAVNDAYNVNRGNFKNKNYRDSQKQRTYENAIRKLKRNAEISKELYEKTGDERYLIDERNYLRAVRQYSKAINTLVGSNPNLTRDIRRENPYRLHNDLGWYYNQIQKNYTEIVEDPDVSPTATAELTIPLEPMTVKLNLDGLESRTAEQPVIQKIAKMEFTPKNVNVAKLFTFFNKKMVERQLLVMNVSRSGGAYYSPTMNLINIKKDGTINTLFHEGGHFLDDMLKGANDYLSGEIPELKTELDHFNRDLINDNDGIFEKFENIRKSDEFTTSAKPSIREKMKTVKELNGKTNEMLSRIHEMTLEENKNISIDFGREREANYNDLWNGAIQKDEFNRRRDEIEAKYYSPELMALKREYAIMNAELTEFSSNLVKDTDYISFVAEKQQFDDIISASIKGGYTVLSKSGKSVTLTGYHDKSYYSGRSRYAPDNSRQKEVFANWFALNVVSSQFVDILRELAPQLAETLDNVMVEAVKKAEIA